jgi:hypothetical protein
MRAKKLVLVAATLGAGGAIAVTGVAFANEADPRPQLLIVQDESAGTGSAGQGSAGRDCPNRDGNGTPATGSAGEPGVGQL